MSVAPCYKIVPLCTCATLRFIPGRPQLPFKAEGADRASRRKAICRAEEQKVQSKVKEQEQIENKQNVEEKDS